MQSRTFEVLGGWVQSEELAPAKLQFHGHSLRCGVHAMSLRELLPDIAGTDAASWVAPPTSAATIFMDDAAGLEKTAARLGAAYALMTSRTVVALRSYLSQAVPISEMPAIRRVAAILADEERDLAAGIGIWESIRKQGDSAGIAVAAIGHLESVIRDNDPFT